MRRIRLNHVLGGIRHEGRSLRTIGARGGYPPRRSQGRRQHGRARSGVGRNVGRADPQRSGAGQRARADPEDSGRRHRPADRRALAAGRRALPRADQGQRQGRRVCRRRAALHGPQQPECAQRAVPRPAEAVGGIHRRQDHLDRSCAGRLQCPPAAGGRDRDGRLRRHRDGRAVRGRRLRQGPGIGSAGLGRQAGRDGRLCRLSQGAGRHLGRQDLSPVDRRRLPHLLLPQRRVLRRRRSPRPGSPVVARATGACRRPGSRCRPSPSS